MGGVERVKLQVNVNYYNGTELIEEGSDIIAINEHWLWPYQHPSLPNLHPDFDGLAYQTTD